MKKPINISKEYSDILSKISEIQHISQLLNNSNAFSDENYTSSLMEAIQSISAVFIFVNGNNSNTEKDFERIRNELNKTYSLIKVYEAEYC
jgi:hypothetical protein